MNNPQSYKITVKVLLTSLIVFTALGLFTGYLAAKIETKAFLKQNPQGNRVIQTIQTQTQASSYVDVIDSGKGNVVGILDEKKDVIQSGVVLTADGIFLTPILHDSQNSIAVMLADGKVVNASLVRAYPEKGVAFYRASSSFSAPQFPASEAIVPGTEGIIIGLSGNNSRITVFPGMVKYFSTEETLDDVVFRERQIKLTNEPSSEFLGAPFFDQQHNLLGVVVNTPKSIVLPVGEINLLLQDYLKHGGGAQVVLLEGLSGGWALRQGSGGRTSAVFKIASVAKNSAFGKAGLQINDIVYAVDDKNFPIAQLWGTFLESVRSVKPVTLSITRGAETIKIPVSITIQNATQQ